MQPRVENLGTKLLDKNIYEILIYNHAPVENLSIYVICYIKTCLILYDVFFSGKMVR
jgi:hypothetical protein